MKTSVVFLFFLLVLVPFPTHPQPNTTFNAFPTLKRLADSLTSHVYYGQYHEFMESFSPPELSNKIINIFGGALFRDPNIRQSFRLTALPEGAKYIGSRKSLIVSGKLQLIIYNPLQRNANIHTFNTIIKQMDNDWKITSLRRVPENQRNSASPSRGQAQRKSLKHNDDWMWSTGYGKK